MPLTLPVRLVLDTNVWLDWLVFDDAGTRAIKTAVAAGTAEIFIGADCAHELARVLACPLGKKDLDSVAQAACLAECRRIARMVEAGERADENGRTMDEENSAPGRLPICRDTNDQKFLELARACRADYLVTRDRALLELARRKLRRAPFRIVTPEQIDAALFPA